MWIINRYINWFIVIGNVEETPLRRKKFKVNFSSSFKIQTPTNGTAIWT